jgi:LmbE family N-acetylglucosaminyl deacetylase
MRVAPELESRDLRASSHVLAVLGETTAGGELMLDGSQGRRRLQAAAVKVKPTLLRAWREALRHRATDDTAAAGERSCLVLAPHPDDETLGAGALIARKRAAGVEVRIVIVTDGRHSHVSQVLDADALAAVRREESIQACKRLGVEPHNLVHLDVPEGTVNTRVEEIRSRLIAEVRDMRPDDVLVTSALDWHVDHRTVSELARAAVAAAPGPRLLEYPVWSWVDGPWSNRPGRSAREAGMDLFVEPMRSIWSARPLRVTCGPQHLTAKREALGAYASQTTNLTGEPTWAVMDHAFLKHFLGPVEIFLHVVPAQGGSTKGQLR